MEAEQGCARLQVDISKARSLLGWLPPVSVDEGFCGGRWRGVNCRDLRPGIALDSRLRPSRA